MATTLEIRNDLRVSVAFTDEDGAAVDPETVRLEVTPPEGYSPAMTTYEYGVGAEIERTGVGAYRSMIYIDAVGAWTYTWLGVGVVHGAKSGCIEAYEGCGEG